MSADLAALIASNPGEVTAVKAAMVRAFRTALPKSIDVYYGVPGSMELPCLTVGEVQITPNGTMGNADAPGMETMVVTVSVFTSNADDEDGQRLLDALLSRRGPVRRAVWAMRGDPGESALDGAADDLSLFDISGYGMISVGDSGSMYGANLSIRVIVS
jgi:hypothetical protein